MLNPGRTKDGVANCCCACVTGVPAEGELRAPVVNARIQFRARETRHAQGIEMTGVSVGQFEAVMRAHSAQRSTALFAGEGWAAAHVCEFAHVCTSSSAAESAVPLTLWRRRGLS